MEDQKDLSHIPGTSEIPDKYIELWDRHNERPIKPEIWDEVIVRAFVNIFESNGFHFFPRQDRGRSVLILEFTKVPRGYSPGRIKNIITG